MCLIIDKPANLKAPKDVVHSAIEINRDGFGVMYAENGKLVIERSLDSKWFTSRINELKSKSVIAHCRFATHGKIDLANCHPFLVTDEIAMVHNGVLAKFGNSVVSDTAEFVELILRPLLTEHPDAFGNPIFTRILETMIGRDNKMILLRSDGATWSLNRSEGLEYNGVWLSNRYAWSQVQVQPKPKVQSEYVSYGKSVISKSTAKRLWDNLPSDDRYYNADIWEDVDNYKLVSDETLDESFDPPEKEEQTITFTDLSKLSYNKLLDLCYDDPDLIADLIFFAYNY